MFSFFIMAIALAAIFAISPIVSTYAGVAGSLF